MGEDEGEMKSEQLTYDSFGSNIGWTICPQCGLRKRGFWATEFNFPCDDCAFLNNKHYNEEQLRKAVASGRVKVSNLTELGRKVCGIFSTTPARATDNQQ
jgi:hypothetical protein